MYVGGTTLSQRAPFESGRWKSRVYEMGTLINKRSTIAWKYKSKRLGKVSVLRRMCSSVNPRVRGSASSRISAKLKIFLVFFFQSSSCGSFTASGMEASGRLSNTLYTAMLMCVRSATPSPQTFAHHHQRRDRTSHLSVF